MKQTMNITDASFQITAALALPEAEVQLWRVDLEAVGATEARWQAVLSSDESTRAARFHFAVDRQRYVATRALLRMILARYLEMDPKDVSFSYSKEEKPTLTSPHNGIEVTFNVSHSGGIALLAFARRREIGVDVEQVREDFDVDAIARRFFSTHELEQLAAVPNEKKFEAFFRCWTRKEAYIKATGDGLSLPLHQFDVSVAPESSDALLSTRPDNFKAALWSLREVPAGDGYVAALCVRGREWHLKSWSTTE